MTTTSERTFHALLRLYPARTRARFGVAMQHAFACDLQVARERGISALVVFWAITFVDTIRCALADHVGGGAVRKALTVDWRDAWRALRSARLVTIFAVLSLG